MINLTKLNIPGLLLYEPRIFFDKRGFFYESFNQKDFEKVVGRKIKFVQDNHSRSSKNVLRGLHFQCKKKQAKLVRVVNGEIFDVVVDLRKNSKFYGKYSAQILSSENNRVLWVPEGFAHGFLTLSDYADVIYKTNNYYYPEYERTLLWNDPMISIVWPSKEKLIISDKDKMGVLLNDL